MTDTGHAMTSWYYHNSYSEIYTVAKMLNIHAIDMKIIHQNIQNILVSTKFSPSADDRAHFFPYFVVFIFVLSSLFSSVSLYNFWCESFTMKSESFYSFCQLSYRSDYFIDAFFFFPCHFIYVSKWVCSFGLVVFCFVFWHVFYLPLTEICTKFFRKMSALYQWAHEPTIKYSVAIMIGIAATL